MKIGIAVLAYNRPSHLKKVLSSIIKEKIKNAILDGEILNDYNQAFDLMLKIGESIGLKDE